MIGLDRQFELTARGTTVRTEILAGLTTFLTMAYIVFVQPAVQEWTLAPCWWPRASRPPSEPC